MISSLIFIISFIIYFKTSSTKRLTSPFATTTPELNNNIEQYLPQPSRYPFRKYLRYNTCDISGHPIIFELINRHGVDIFPEITNFKKIFKNKDQLSSFIDVINKIFIELKEAFQYVFENIENHEAFIKENSGLCNSFRSRLSNTIRWGYNLKNNFKNLLIKYQDLDSNASEFFSEYSNILVNYLLNKIESYGIYYTIPDLLLSRIVLANEFDSLFKRGNKYNWEISVKDIVRELNDSLLKSYESLKMFIDSVKDQKDKGVSKDEFSTALKNEYDKFFEIVQDSIKTFQMNMKDLYNKSSELVVSSSTEND